MNTFTYEAPFQIHALSWSNRSDQMFRLAVATRDRIHGDDDDVQIIRFDPHQGFRPFHVHGIDNEPVSATAVAFFPRTECNQPDLLACATADTLSLWSFRGRFLVNCSDLSPNPRLPHITITTIEWNAEEPRRIASVCSRGSCAVWDIERGIPEVHFFTSSRFGIANDISWGSSDVFAACFTDGNVKIVDLRMRQPIPIYRSHCSIHKVEWSALDRNNIALSSGAAAAVIDPRWLQFELGHAFQHQDVVKSIAWDPITNGRLCTAGRDSRAVMWELPSPERGQAFRTFVTSGPIQQLMWSTLHPTWAALGFNNQLQIVEVVNADGGIAF